LDAGIRVELDKKTIIIKEDNLYKEQSESKDELGAKITTRIKENQR
jgi:hypothetical protein